MKRILIFSMTYHPFVGGAEVAIKEITDRMPPEEYEFHMVTLRFNSDLPKVEQVGNIMVHRIGFARPGITTDKLRTFPLHFNKYLYQVYAPLYASRLHRKYHFTGQWAIMAHVCGVPAALFNWMHPNVKYLLTLQEGDPPAVVERMVRPLWPLFTRAFTKADAVQAISTFLMAWAKRRGFQGLGRVIPNGVDTKRFAVLPIKKQGEEVRLVTTSRLVHKNAVDDVIRALSHLPHTVTFVIYGIGPEEPNLRALAREVGVEDRVRFMGQVAYEHIPEVLAACDIFVRPSRSEGMGNSFIEAMAAGLPVIATQEGGIADFLFDAIRNPGRPTTGWAVDVDAPQQIANAVLEILGHPGRVKEVTATARALVQSQYDWERVAGDMRTLFSEVFI
jgi:glycosyltransferase involved in cell wall biosynthesis